MADAEPSSGRTDGPGSTDFPTRTGSSVTAPSSGIAGGPVPSPQPDRVVDLTTDLPSVLPVVERLTLPFGGDGTEPGLVDRTPPGGGPTQAADPAANATDEGDENRQIRQIDRADSLDAHLTDHPTDHLDAGLLVLDALLDEVAVVGSDGTVLWTNTAWAEFAAANPHGLHRVNGSRLFDEPADHPSEQDLHALIEGIRGIVGRKRSVYQRDVTVTDSGINLARSVTVTPLDMPIGLGAIVVMADITPRKELEARLEHQAMHDPLTGLANRALLMDRLKHALHRAERTSAHVALLMIDLDHFKALNDTLGHLEADEVLRAVARRLVSSSRPGDTVARFGGDELAVVCEDVSDARMAGRIAQRLRTMMSAPLMTSQGSVDFTVSMGVALARGDQRIDARTLLEHADTALYRAKLQGRDRWELFDDELRAEVTERLNMERDLRQAVERGEFRLDYQPMVDLWTGRALGAEALLRWDHPTMGTVPPARFVPVAEDVGVIGSIGKWVLEEACRCAATWPSEIGVSVNLSGRQIADPDIVFHVVEALEDSGLEPERLTLELTESVLIVDGAKASDKLTHLRALGVHIALDDFGTGFSSLSYLHRFPVDAVKIDRSFVEGLGRDPGAPVIVSAIVSMAQALGIAVIAEGVESDQQRDALGDLGLGLAQGFLFARPMAATAFAATLAT